MDQIHILSNREAYVICLQISCIKPTLMTKASFDRPVCAIVTCNGRCTNKKRMPCVLSDASRYSLFTSLKWTVTGYTGTAMKNDQAVPNAEEADRLVLSTCDKWSLLKTSLECDMQMKITKQLRTGTINKMAIINPVLGWTIRATWKLSAIKHSPHFLGQVCTRIRRGVEFISLKLTMAYPLSSRTHVWGQSNTTECRNGIRSHCEKSCIGSGWSETATKLHCALCERPSWALRDTFCLFIGHIDCWSYNLQHFVDARHAWVRHADGAARLMRLRGAE